jgi:predicted dehydrogenase
MASPAYNIAIIGYGFSAKVFQIPLILANSKFNLHTIVQRHAKAGSDAAHDFPRVIVRNKVNDALNDKAVDVVVICTTPGSHFDLASQALNSGKHGMCVNEIPLP